MFKVPTPRTQHRHESTWDHHGSYQWTYFSEPIKQRISFFLARRLRGRNLDLGSGWYLSYPDSTAVDLSSVCLDYNPAKERLQFDLDEIAAGKRLPYEDRSFDSATAISVWQYLASPGPVVRELQRVLKPGAELYVINGQGGGLEECLEQSCRSEDIRKHFQMLDYDTLVERIPCPDGNTSEFQSVCVAMPGKDLFGETHSCVSDRERRELEDQALRENPSVFSEAYKDAEMRTITSKLARLRTFPVTRDSQGYLERCEQFSQECAKHGGMPLLFAEHTIPPAVLMQTPGSNHLFPTIFMLGASPDHEAVYSMLDAHDISFCWHSNYFHHSTKEQVLQEAVSVDRLDDSTRDTSVRRFSSFLASIPLNACTAGLQEELYAVLARSVSDLDGRIAKGRSFAYSMCVTADKQRRRIDELIEAKRRIIDEGLPVVRYETLGYKPYLKSIRDGIE